MLGCIVKKEDKYIYNGKWISDSNNKVAKWFKFALVEDDNTVERDFNNLSGVEGTMKIMTKSTIPFSIDDEIWFQNQKYQIVLIDGNRKGYGELAFINMKVNGNVPIYITLRKAG